MSAGKSHCYQCNTLVFVHEDETHGFSCCSECGAVLSEVAFSSDVQFTKDASGAAAPSTRFVRDGATISGRVGRDGREYGPSMESHEKCLEKGRNEIVKLINSLDFRESRESNETEALQLYRLALDKGFTKGRKITMVAAACLYTICRKHSLPYLLMDFSDATGINVYILGAVPVDPALYMHRYASRLGFGDKGKEVSDTATRIVSSMKRDWIHTGRRPSGVCGAALLIAAHIHGFSTTRREVISVVHIGASTLGKRVEEFGATRAGNMKVAEFDRRSREEDRLLRDLMANATASHDSLPENEDLLCVHIQRDGEAHFGRGMCEKCFRHQLNLEGMADGDDPPAYKAALLKAERAELERMEKEGTGFLEDDEFAGQYGEYGGPLPIDHEAVQITQEMAQALVDEHLSHLAKAYAPQHAAAAAVALQREQPQAHEGSPAQDYGPCLAIVPVSPSNEVGQQFTSFSGAVQEAANPSESEMAQLAIMPVGDGQVAAPDDEQAERDDEELSDLSDDEVQEFFYTAQESAAKKQCWDAANHDWVEKAQLKAEAAARQAQEAANASSQEGELVSKKNRGRPPGSRNRAHEEKYTTPAANAAEAVKRLFASSKNVSKKFNEEVVSQLYNQMDENAQPSAVSRQPAPDEDGDEREEERMEEQGEEGSEEGASHTLKVRQEEAAKKRKARAALYGEDATDDPQLRRLGSLMSPPKAKMRPHRLASLF